MRKSGAEIILEVLEEEGINTVFGYPGGAILPLYDAMYTKPNLNHILVNHEQGATIAAEGYSRVTNKVGVAIATSGPGATNTVTGIANAYMDSIPLVVITGQVPTSLVGTDGFQETDIIGVTAPITKINYLVTKTEDLYPIFKEAFYLAKSGRPGPVLIDIPKDVQANIIEFERTTLKEKITESVPYPYEETIEQIVDNLLSSEKPIIYIGGGLKSNAEENAKLLQELLELIDIPIASSLMGLGIIPSNNVNFLGMLGMHGYYECNMALHNCQFALCIGTRFSDRTTGRLDNFMPNTKIAHVDISYNSINKTVTSDISLVADATLTLKAIVNRLKARLQNKTQDYPQWWEQIRAWQATNSTRYRKNPLIIRQQDVILEVAKQVKNKSLETLITTEVGQHQMYVAQHYPLNQPLQWLTSGGAGTMGFGLPAALGAQVAFPDKTVICFSGDGSIMMNVQELATLGYYDIPVKIVILNNSRLGMVYQWQDLVYDKRFSHSVYDKKRPDFVTIAQGCKIQAKRVTTHQELASSIVEMLESNKAYLLEVVVDHTSHVTPMLAPGAAHNEMTLREDLEDI